MDAESQQSQAESELKRRLNHLKLMLKINNEMVSQLDLQGLLRVITSSIREVVKCDTVGVGLFDPESGQLRTFANVVPPEHPLREKGTPIPLEGNPAGLAFTSGQPVFVDKPEFGRFPSELIKQLHQDGYRSGGAVPLIAQGRKLGILGVSSKRENAFSDDDKELLCQVANQVALAVDNAINFESARATGIELKRRLDHLRLMLKITTAVVSQLDLREVLKVVSSSIREVMGNDIVGVSLFDQESGKLRAFATDFPSDITFKEEAYQIPLEDTLPGLAFISGEPVFVDKPDLERYTSDYDRMAYEYGYRSGGNIPLIAQGRKLGILGFASKRENAFSNEDKELLLQIANQVAIAVDNALNYERAREAERELARRLEHLQLMLKITNAVVSQLDLQELLQIITTSIRQVMGSDIGGVALFDHDSGQLRSFATDVPLGHLLDEKGLSIQLEGGPAGLAFTSGRPVFLDKPDLARFPSDLYTRMVEDGYKSSGRIPLILQGRKLGILAVDSKRENAFSNDDKELLCQVANQVAIAVSNALNFERAREAEQQAKRQSERLQLLLEINNAVVSTLDLRELLKVISLCLRQAIPHDAALLTLHDPESRRLRLQALDLQMFGQVPFEEGVLISIEDTPEGQAITSRRPVLVTPVIDFTRFSSPWVRRAYDNGVRSGCAVPLISHDRTLGALSIVSLRENAFTEDDAELLNQCASQIAISVENALNFGRARKAEQRAERELERSQLLLEINNAVVSHLDLKELVKTVSASLRDIIPHDSAGIALYEPELNQLREYTNVSYIDLNAFRVGDTIPLEGTPAGQVFLTGQPLLIRRPNQEKYPADRYSQLPVEDSPKSACLAPLISHGRNLGVAGVSSTQIEKFTEEDLELFSQIASQIAIAVENAINFERAREAEKEIRRHYDQLRLMLEINNAVVTRLDLRELIHVTASCLREVLHHEIAGLSLYDPLTNQLRAYAYDFPDKQFVIAEGTPIPLEGSIGGMAFTSGRAVFFNHPRSEGIVSDFNKRMVQMGVKSGGCVPLIVHGRKLGVLGVASLREDAFPEDHQELLAQVSSQIAIAVDNALNFELARTAEEQAKRQSERLQLLLEINNAVVSDLDLRNLIKTISSSLCKVSSHDIVALALYDPEIDRLHAYVTDRPNNQPYFEEGQALPLEGSVVGLAFSTGQPVFTDHPNEERFNSDFSKQFREAGFQSVGCVPLLAKGRKLGVLGVASKREHALSVEDKELLVQVANQVSIAVDNALNFERALKAEQEVKRQLEREHLMLEINNAVVSHLSLRELMRVISSCLREVLHPDITGISLYDPETNQFRAYQFDLPNNLPAIEEGTPMPIEGTFGGLAYISGRPVFMSRPDPEKLSHEFDRRLIDAGIRSGGVVPLIAHDRKLGFLGVGSFREAAFSESDQELLGHIANQIAIAVENALAYQEIETLKNKLASEKLYLEDEIRTEHNFEELIGETKAFKRILKQVETVAPTGSTVLIRGETGTGKELLARAIHNLSERRDRTLVKINCAAIPMGLLESELFGHEKGAFTGAISQRIGRFELANRGTLFLDEVGDIPLELQPKLLRVLQEQEFERLGSTRTQRVDVRLIAATNSDLEQMVADKKYRSDLYYRLNVFPITIPPLRERRADIPALARFFTQKYARRLKKRIEAIPAEAMAAFTNYHWPGNVRELEHFIERAVVLTQGTDLEVSLSDIKPAAQVNQTPISTLEAAEREHILRALEDSDWIVGGPNGAAARLGMKRTTLQSRMRKMGLERRQ